MSWKNGKYKRYLLYYEFQRFIDLVPVVEQFPQWIKEKEKFEQFLENDLYCQQAQKGELKEAIDEVLVKNIFGKCDYLEKIICFIYSKIMDFKKTNKIKGIPTSEKFIENIKGILNNQTLIHHFHISGEILGYSHSYCNLKVRENKRKISVIPHSLFRFDFFFFLKGIRASSWRTRDINIGGKNPTDMNFVHIGNQVVFIDTVNISSRI